MATASPDLSSITLAARELFERDLELIPIPTVQVVREGDGFEFLAVNRAYRLAGLGVIADRSPMLAMLGSRIDAFLRTSDVRIDFDWSIGQVIDSRYYRVTIARPTTALRDRCQIAFIDLTAQVHTERSLRREMTTDSLTGLPNREGFSDMIEAVQAERSGHAVLVIDIDRFGGSTPASAASPATNC